MKKRAVCDIIRIKGKGFGIRNAVGYEGAVFVFSPPKRVSAGFALLFAYAEILKKPVSQS